MSAADQVTDLLTALGATPDAIADRLRALGIKGTPNNSSWCPIANYLIRHIEDPDAYVYDIAVSPGEIALSIDYDAGHRYLYLRPNTSAATFIRRFDRGDYPHLIQTPTEVQS